MNMSIAVSDLIQAERILRIETPLGVDVLLPERFEMREEVSGLFEISIAVRSKRLDLKADELVGKLVDISLETGPDGGGGTRRTWNGLVVELVEGPQVTRGLRSYHLIIKPEHWLLTQKSDCRIWLDKTAVEVAQILMGEHGLASPVTTGVIDPPPANHYSVQWNETDWDYLTRRLEEDGIFFWFEHEGGEMGSVAATHTLHIASYQSGYVEGPETDLRFAMGSTDRNHIYKFEKRFRFIPGKRAGADWNFETPGGVPGGETPSIVTLPKNGNYELYEYPAIKGYGSGARASEGIMDDMVEGRSKLRMMAAEADHERIEGQSTVRTMAPGRRFKPYDVANPDNVFEEHVVVGILHTAEDRSYETGDGEPDYRNTFMALPSRVPATPHRTTPRPSIDGSQIALVAGPEGEEIHPDEYGRIKVWFPWDRRAVKDGTDTCWMRVTQNWAGAGWGGQVIPRIGMEVMVTYLDGDPDRPVITGVVPNPRQKVPYDLPANKTRSTFRTNTHKSKTRNQYNELRFEDEAGREELYMHAQKDMSVRVRDNRVTNVGGLSVENVDKDRWELVGNTSSLYVAKDYNVEVGIDRQSQGMLEFLNLGNDNLQKPVFGYDAMDYPSGTTGDYRLTVKGTITMRGYSTFNIDATENIRIQSDRSINIDADKDIDINGLKHVDIMATKAFTGSAGDLIKLEVGGSSVTISKDGRIRIRAQSMELHADSDIDIRAGSKITLKAPRIDLN